ncbi:MAG: hypothetical protein U0R77_02365 [Mycolicibacterium insubricum]
MARHSTPRRTPRAYLTWHNVTHDLKELVVSGWIDRGGAEQALGAVLFGAGLAVGYHG